MLWNYWDPSIFKKIYFILFNQSNRLELAIPSSKINPLYRIFNTHVFDLQILTLNKPKFKNASKDKIQ
ncbi:hypothetical protein BpHYR1_017379 [Brachionus plicatilis]|uniref:Uncharacterized protein n=1 Tax=Brachionus plicatilis TaxID=10195 RepID=A0A3M7P5G7_BRAPC|nr:hypothetical protein BpHYR1_017379 [Brachionus plicatilis]